VGVPFEGEKRAGVVGGIVATREKRLRKVKGICFISGLKDSERLRGGMFQKEGGWGDLYWTSS